jgi:hypothetical protein
MEGVLIKVFIVGLILYAYHLLLKAQSSLLNDIRGKVIEGISKKPLPDVQIFLEGTDSVFAAVSNDYSRIDLRVSWRKEKPI